MNADALQLWGLAAFLVVVVLVLLLRPLLRREGAGVAPREAYDINVYKDQLLEIDADLERGLLSADQGEAARTEIKRRMLAAAGDAETAEAGVSAASNRGLAAAIALLVPLGGVLTYLALGQPGHPDQPLAERRAQALAQQTEQDREMLEATAKLAKHLQANPDDLRGWRLLARTYLTQERYGEAVAAYGEAYRLSPDDPDILVNYGETLTLAGDSEVGEQARGLFEKALALDALSPKARYYLGLYRAQKGDVRAALRHWIDLALLSPPDAPWMPVLDRQIARAAEQSGIDPATVEPSPGARALAAELKKGAAAEGPGPTTEDVKAAMGLSQGDRDEMIRSMVQRLADRLKDNPGDKDGWLRLEKAYRVLGETAKADDAAARAAKLP